MTEICLDWKLQRAGGWCEPVRNFLCMILPEQNL